MVLIKCVGCGHDLNTEDICCTNCGSPINAKPIVTEIATKSVPDTKNKLKIWHVFTIVFTSIALMVSTIFLVVVFSIGMDSHNLNYPLTAILPMFLAIIFFVGVLLLHISAIKNRKGFNVKKQTTISVILIGFAFLMIPVVKSINASISKNVHIEDKNVHTEDKNASPELYNPPDDSYANTETTEDELYMSPNDYETIYGILKYHEDMIAGKISKAEAIGTRTAWKLNRSMYKGIMQRCAYYAEFGDIEYVNQYKNRPEITVEQVQERIKAVYARYNDKTTLDEFNSHAIQSNKKYEDLGFLD